MGIPYQNGSPMKNPHRKTIDVEDNPGDNPMAGATHTTSVPTGDRRGRKHGESNNKLQDHQYLVLKDVKDSALPL